MEIGKLFSVEGKVIVVTGGGRGIGKMIAEGFVKNGAKVYIASRKLEACKDTADELTAQGPGTCIPLQADLSTEEGCTALAKEIKDRETRLDVLVNNSGVAVAAEIENFTGEHWDRVLNLNLKALFFLTRDLLPLLDVAGVSDDGARVINIGSISGLQPQTLNTYSYDTSKAAVHHLTRVLACKLAKRPNGGKINVNGIAPGMVSTTMTQPVASHLGTNLESMAASIIPLGRHALPSDLAGVSLFLASRASAWITGEVICMDGGQTKATESRLL